MLFQPEYFFYITLSVQILTYLQRTLETIWWIDPTRNRWSDTLAYYQTVDVPKVFKRLTVRL